MLNLNFHLCHLFQFHKGTIKTKKSNSLKGIGSSFQFHKGTIKTSSASCVALCGLNFNSIKVRLKLIKMPLES